MNLVNTPMNTSNAKLISVALHPLLTPAVGFLMLITTNERLNLTEKVISTVIAVSFSCLFPIASLWYLLQKGTVESIDVVVREQRPWPLTLASMNYFIGFLLLSYVQAPELVQGLMFCYGTNTLVVALITFWWKVSVHTTAMSALLVALTYSFGPWVLPFFVFVSLVGISRVVLNRHTVSQVIVGGLLGLVLTAIQIQLFFQPA
jgi:membrane-associated phospholipid phosphatase